MECDVSFCTWRHLHASKRRVCISTCQNHNIVTIPLFLVPDLPFPQTKGVLWCGGRMPGRRQQNKWNTWLMDDGFRQPSLQMVLSTFLPDHVKGWRENSRFSNRVQASQSCVSARSRACALGSAEQQFSDNSSPGYLYFKCIGHIDCSFILRPVIC